MRTYRKLLFARATLYECTFFLSLVFYFCLREENEKKRDKILTSLLSVRQNRRGIFNGTRGPRTHTRWIIRTNEEKKHIVIVVTFSRVIVYTYIYIIYIYIYSHTRTHTHIRPTYVILCQFVSRSAFRSRSKQSRFLWEKKSIEESICHDTNLCFYGAQAA